MAIPVQRHANVSKQATLFDGLDVSPLKWCVCGCGWNRFVHEGMSHFSNAKVHLKIHSGNVNIWILSQNYEFSRLIKIFSCRPGIFKKYPLRSWTFFSPFSHKLCNTYSCTQRSKENKVTAMCFCWPNNHILWQNSMIISLSYPYMMHLSLFIKFI